MKRCIFLFGLLLLIVGVEGSEEDRFFISAPNVFHLGVREKVFVQVGGTHLNEPITLYLKEEPGNVLLSEKIIVTCTEESPIQLAELMIIKDTWSRVQATKQNKPYLMLVAENKKVSRLTRVLVSPHRGYIFIQTDQPVYNPTQTVRYRIFTLDHMLRPQQGPVHISITNAAGNTILKSFNNPTGGIYSNSFSIPSVSKTGTWKITAHYDHDVEKAAVREFEVRKFVLPSFEVKIAVEQRYVLLKDEYFNFTIAAMYTHGEKVNGSYHCKFGVVNKGTIHGEKMKPDFIKGLEMTGSVKDGSATLSLQLDKFDSKLKEQLNETLSDLLNREAQLYLGVFVINIQSSEIQEGEVYLPVISNKYILDLSRTRSYFLPGYPIEVVVVMRLPDGSPAADVQINIDIEGSTRESHRAVTNQDGAVFHVFNINSENEITIQVSADGLQERKILKRFSSQSDSYLYLIFANRVYSVNEIISLTFSTSKAPTNGRIYYMVLSRGVIIKTGSLGLGISVKTNLQITAEMVPSFRVIGYYYSSTGDIVADSIWVDVRDECEIKVEVNQKTRSVPGKLTELQLNLHGQAATVALLAVDKAFYALNVDNKLTAKQVFSAMKSYDLGCSYTGGFDSASTLVDAGLSFTSHSANEHSWRQEFDCNSQSSRQRRSVDLQLEREKLTSEFQDAELQACCSSAFSPIPMKRTCEERAARVLRVKKNQTCVDAFLKCCKEAERLKHKMKLDEAQTGFGRTSIYDEEIINFFTDPAAQYIRRYFPPSFAFTHFDVNDKRSHFLTLPDSITTWEIQIATLSSVTGFCVVKPYEVRAFKDTFISLRLPPSVKKYEQVSVSPVIYNYADKDITMAVHMEQTEGLCSPNSATKTSYTEITVRKQSSRFISLTVVPMVTGSIPIKIHLYDTELMMGIDAIEKSLKVQTEGLEERVEETYLFKLDGRRARTFPLDGTLPDNIVPDSSSNMFVSAEGAGFGTAQVRTLLSHETVSKLIIIEPSGCLEQTVVKKLAPLALALRYLDLTNQWFDLPPNSRDNALNNIEKGLLHIKARNFKVESSGAYRPWESAPYSNWVTAFVVKVLSLIAERESGALGPTARSRIVNEAEIEHSVGYLLSIQKSDGSFSDPHPVVNRNLKNHYQDASITAFITIALNRSLPFLNPEIQTKAEGSIIEATNYLKSQLSVLNHNYAVAITAYCLSTCLPRGANRLFGWKMLQSLVTEKDGCYQWTYDDDTQTEDSVWAATVETTAYALLAAVEVGDMDWADKIACWLTRQENYFGGYRSTQDTIVALEALAEYELKRSTSPVANMVAEFTVPGRNERAKLEMQNPKDKVEVDLRKFVGNEVMAQLSGVGEIKLKTVKAYHLLEPKDGCVQLSIRVTVEGKVEYTAKITENYDYYDYDANQDQATQSSSMTEMLDVLTRSRRDVENEPVSEVVTYNVCVSRKLDHNLTGMAIADITLLSGFEAETEDLEKLMQPPEQYITHYEISYGRVIIYFNELFENEECFSFKAKQTIPVGLLQPAPAVFYDYYEPKTKCTVFYSAPKRGNLVAKLCTEDVCQCAERPCHKVKDTFDYKNRKITKADRAEHACLDSKVDYAYVAAVDSISVKSNFELYQTNITEVLKSNGDMTVGENSVRVFAKRLHCKGQLELGKQYLIMGKDGATTDSNHQMQYLLEEDTWIEKMLQSNSCRRTSRRTACEQFTDFLNEYKLLGCKI